MTMNGDVTKDHSERITKLETAFENVSKSIDTLVKSQQNRDEHIDKQFNTLYGKLDSRTRINPQTWIAGLALIGMLIFGVWTPFANGLSEKLANVQTQDSLADRLQTVRLDRNEQDVRDLKEWNKEMILSDLAELRQRRMGNEMETNRK